MYTSRRTLTHFLELESKKNPVQFHHYQTLAYLALQKGFANRLFDDFPCLLQPREMQPLIKELEILLGKFKSQDLKEIENKTLITNKALQKAIFSWQRKIIDYGFHDLIDSKGKIKADILKLLDIEEFKFNPWEMLCAYVGSINQIIYITVKNNLLDAKEYSFNFFDAIFDFVNQNYGNWSRFFLKVPSLTSEIEMRNYEAKLKYMLILTGNKNKTFSTLNMDEKNIIHEWQLMIIKNGISKLIDDNGEILPVFFKFNYLNSNDTNKLTPNELIQVYLHAINNQIKHTLRDFIYEYAPIAENIFKYIEENDVQWINETLKKITKKSESKEKSMQELLNPLKTSSPGLLLVLAAFGTGYLLFKNCKEQKNPDYEIKNNYSLH